MILLIPMLIPADGERMTEAPEDYSSLILLHNLYTCTYIPIYYIYYIYYILYGERMTKAPEDYSSLVLLNNLCQEIRIRIANAFAKRREGGDFYLETDTEGKW